MEIKITGAKLNDIKAEAVLVVCYEAEPLSGLAAEADAKLGGLVSDMLKRQEFKGKLEEIAIVPLGSGEGVSRLCLLGLGKRSELEADKYRRAVAGALRQLRKRNYQRIAVELAVTEALTAEEAARAVAEGAVMGLYEFKNYLTREAETKEVQEITVVAGSGSDLAPLERAVTGGRVVAEAVNRARDLVNEPANQLTPSVLAQRAQQMAAQFGLEITVMEPDEIKAEGMGAFLGVASGSDQPARFIVMNYKGKKEAGIDVALVGKGITFDSGGISIKPSDKMDEMKGDMGGGAAVLATMTAVAQLKPSLNVVALVPATENLPGGSALKPGDVLKALNGKTIEVLNTDAEGRLILADALSYAAKMGAAAIIDVATLTGACVVALGEMNTGVFSNNQPLADRVLAAGKAAGEPLWQMPMNEEYRELLKSDVADLQNIGGRWGGAITAALFLSEFTGDKPWVHLDIAGPNLSSKERGHWVKGATGVPVMTLVKLLMEMAG